MIETVDFKYQNYIQIFELYDIYDKIEHLIEVIGQESRTYKERVVFINIVIVIPYYAKNMIPIKDIDEDFCRIRINNANTVAKKLEESGRIRVVALITDPVASVETVRNLMIPIDYVVFLDPITSLERDYIGSKLTADERSKHLCAIELLARTCV